MAKNFYWAPFLSNKLYISDDYDYKGEKRTVPIFATKRECDERFSVCRKVKIVEVK